MNLKEEIKDIKDNSERNIQGLRTNLREFRYQDTNGFVKPNTLYSIYYTFDKEQIYLTGVDSTNNSRKITKIDNESNFEKYTSLGSNTRNPYPKPKGLKPTESDYRIGSVARYFCKITNDVNSDVFEIDKNTFNEQNSLYEYTTFKWKISGLKQDVERENQMTINRLIRDFPTITKELFPLQLWTPPKDSMEDVENKLRRLKK